MKIVIKESESKRKLRFIIPTALIKWQWIYSIIIKNIKDEDKRNTVIKFKSCSKQIYKVIKEYIRANGHFVLADVESDGDIVKITV